MRLCPPPGTSLESAAHEATDSISPLGALTPKAYHQARHSTRIDPHLGAPGVDDTNCLRFFLEPTQTFHRQYEALRSVFVEDRPLSDVPHQFGYTDETLRSLVRDFRARCRAGQASPFSPPRDAGDLLGITPPDHRPAQKRPPSPMYVNWTSLQDAVAALGSLASSCSFRS